MARPKKQPAEPIEPVSDESVEVKPEERNKDGLIPGQLVDSDTLRRIELARRNKQ